MEDTELNTGPGEGTNHLTVVGIGASAGGLAALRGFFDEIPPDSGLVFVVVVHLSPEHESHLAELLQPSTKIPVMQVTETVALEPNHAYIIPPNANLEAVDTHLRLSALEERGRMRAPIDHFFRTLSRTHKGHAIGVILTGTGSDGTLGLKDIREKGGLALVQEPGDAEYDGMPQSAVATGQVDLVLPLTEIPAAVLRYARMEPRIPLPSVEGEVEGDGRRLLMKLFGQIRARTGRDFTHYKRSTVLRRIARRMQIAQVEEFESYLDLLRRKPEEVGALADDILVTVTSFFRDPEIFQTLAGEVIPGLFRGKGPDDELRVWSVGCATGEEAYSLAILLAEEAARHEMPPHLQIFASDLHERSLARARAGFYPGDIEADVKPRRLNRFFRREDGGYQVRDEIREMVVFAPHNLLGDPPFSRIDLIVCRNLLIYLQREIQSDIAVLFHYALKPGGFLILGTSERMEATDLFRTEHKKQSIYRRRDVPGPEPRLPVFPMSLDRFPEQRRHASPFEGREPVPFGDLHQRMVERYAPPSILVSPEDNVLHLSEHAGRYLVHPGGELTPNVFKLVRKDLRIELRAALHEVRETGLPRRTSPVPVAFNGESARVVMDVRPSPDAGDEGLVLVIFDERGKPEARLPSPAEEGEAAPGDSRMAEVRAERDLARQRLQAVIEEYETSREEMRASNEELQSMNEELRSTMEELETSKEELQSMNEELQTVNQENRHKVAELAALSSDLQNLLSATDIATIFLDRELRILRFTPQVGALFNVRMTDRGRPLSDLSHRLADSQILEGAKKVLKTLESVEREVRDQSGKWYMARMLPYRSTEDRIEGVVLTFVDITERRDAEEALRDSEARFRALLTASNDVVYRMGPDWNEMRRLEGRGFIPDTEDASTTWLERYIPPEDQAFVQAAIQQAIRTRTTFELEHRVRRVDGTMGWTLSRAVPMLDQNGEIQEWFGAAKDITRQRRGQEALEDSERRFRAVTELVPDLLWRSDRTGAATWFNRRWTEHTGQPMEKARGWGWVEAIHPDEREQARRDLAAASARGEPVEQIRRIRGQAGTDRWFLLRAEPLLDEEGEVREWFGSATDIHDQRTVMDTLEERVQERTKELKRSREEIIALASRLSLAEQEERRRISRLLHDDLQQLLYGAQMKLTLARDGAKAEEAGGVLPHLDGSLALLEDAILKTRRMTLDINPPVLEGEGLVEALRWLQNQMKELHGLDVELRAEELDVGSREKRLLLFGAVRELLFNVTKHSGAEKALVEVAGEEGGIRVAVSDHGRGFDAEVLEVSHEEPKGLGLFSLRERLRMQGGSVEVHSHPGEGTRVEFYVPLPEPS